MNNKSNVEIDLEKTILVGFGHFPGKPRGHPRLGFPISPIAMPNFIRHINKAS